MALRVTLSLRCGNRVEPTRDLEGMVAKLASGTYIAHPRRTTWIKIRNPEYSQAVNRGEWMNLGKRITATSLSR
jgi:ATP-dependent DNA ligase